MLRYNSQPQKMQQPCRLWSMALVSLVMLGGVSTQTAVALPMKSQLLTAQVKQTPAAKNRLPQRVAQRVRRDLAARLDVAPRTLQVVGSSRETWPDACLGLAGPNERCAMSLVEGWRVELTNGQQNWVYRTDLRAEVIKLETQDKSELPPQVVDRLFEAIAEQTDVPASSLRVVEAKPATWDGCMGIYEPGRACTRIAIAGWQVIVAGDQQTWVYHVSEDASRIAQNATASGSQGEIFVSFIPPVEGQEPTPIDENVVLRMTVSGGIAGIVTETILTTDGTLYSQASRLNVPTTQPTVIKKLSPRQVEEFQQVLQNQRFPNLNGLRYLTSAALADYPTTTFQAMGSTVEYIDLEKENLPQALQEVIQAWEGL